ncbi:hypothetical protein F4604DRAFT_1625023 [Suillus subluteus]|nr:hypothetical protein F4604DRAFT_1625023 [Suillus subluteus]
MMLLLPATARSGCVLRRGKDVVERKPPQTCTTRRSQAYVDNISAVCFLPDNGWCEESAFGGTARVYLNQHSQRRSPHVLTMCTMMCNLCIMCSGSRRRMVQTVNFDSERLSACSDIS